MSFFLSILVAVLLLSVIVLFHEMGHFFAARLTGIAVMEFSIGLGPRIFKRERNGIVYSLRALPLGGMVRFYGEDEACDDDRAFNRQARWKRFLAIAAGGLMNIALALVLAVLLLSVYGDIVGVAYPAKIVSVDAQSPAEQAGLKAEDVIVSIEGQAVESIEDVQWLFQTYGEKLVRITVNRGGENVDLTVTPKAGEDGVLRIGIMTGQEYIYQKYGFFKTIGRAFEITGNSIRSILDFLGQLVSFKIPAAELEQNFVGPVGVYSIVASAVQSGFQWVLQVAIFISVNLGVVNLLPLPALDGSRLLFLLIEAIRGKQIAPEKEGMVHFIGFVMLLALIAFVTVKDIGARARAIAGAIKSISSRPR
jgi:regulator of sigma E protease